MLRLIFATVIAIMVLLFVFETRRPQATDETRQAYFSMVEAQVEAQPLGSGLAWHARPVPAPSGARFNFVTLRPKVIDWSGETGGEGRQLPPPPKVPPDTPRPRHVGRGDVRIVAEGQLQTEWILLRSRGIGEHKLLRGRIGGKEVSVASAQFGSLPDGDAILKYYECYSVPFTIYRYREEIPARTNSCYPLGKRLIDVGSPWVVYGKPGRLSLTTCRATLVPRSPEFKDRVPGGVFEARVRGGRFIRETAND